MAELENRNNGNKKVVLQTEILLAYLLEEKCESLVEEKNDSRRLFQELCTSLAVLGVLPPSSFSDASRGSRIEQGEFLDELLKSKAEDFMLGDGEENICVEFLSAENTPQQHSRYDADFIELGELGKGGFGSVFKAKHNLSGTVYAVKKIKQRPNEDMLKLLREVQALANLTHKNIVGYNNAWLEDASVNYPGTGSSSSQSSEGIDFNVSRFRISSNEDPQQDSESRGTNEKKSVLYIQMELCTYNLQDWLSTRNDAIRDIPLAKKKHLMRNYNIHIFRHILEGVNFIHANGLMHRDLTPNNIFLTGKDLMVKTDEDVTLRQMLRKDLHAKIGDFGLVKYFMKGGRDGGTVAPTDEAFQHTQGVGTLLYASPEQLIGSEYDNKSDMYSLGVILFEMFNTFGTAMERNKEITQLRKTCQCPTIFRKLWSKLEGDVIETLIRPLPKERPSTQKILKYRYFCSEKQVEMNLRQTVKQQQKEMKRMRRELSFKENLIEINSAILEEMETTSQIVQTDRLENLGKVKQLLQSSH